MTMDSYDRRSDLTILAKVADQIQRDLIADAHELDTIAFTPAGLGTVLGTLMGTVAGLAGVVQALIAHELTREAQR